MQARRRDDEAMGQERSSTEAARCGPDEETRHRIMGAMLSATGELGYRAVSVSEVLTRCGSYRSQFYRYFPNKGACYQASYAEGSAALTAQLLAAESCGDWRAALQESLRRLGRFLVECPHFARGLLVEVHVARGEALARHREVVERLSRAIDRARREPEARHSPPPLTAEFMVRALESAATSALLSGNPRRFESAVPELAGLVVQAYFGSGS